MSSTAVWQRWEAEKEGVKIGERVVGYAAEECRRMTALESTAGISDVVLVGRGRVTTYV
jgi:hypothetical protein